MIILEGCDCTGKTTLAEKLSAKYNASVTHYSKHDENVMMAHALTIFVCAWWEVGRFVIK